MSMSWAEHAKRAETLLAKAEENLAQAGRQDEYRRVEIQVQIAMAHAHLADTKRVVK